MSERPSRDGAPLSVGAFALAVVVLSVLGVLAVALVGTGIERLGGPAARPESPADVPSGAGDPVHARLAASTEAVRRRAFTAMLPVAVCGQAVETYYQGTREGVAVWSVRCGNGRSWQVRLAATDAAPVLTDCEAAGAVARCFTRF